MILLTMFCQTVDEVFDNLINKFGMENDILVTKELILSAYFNEDKNKSKQIYNKIKPVVFSIDSNGDIEIIKKVT
jgi:hypothetical protein